MYASASLGGGSLGLMFCITGGSLYLGVVLVHPVLVINMKLTVCAAK